MLITILIKYAIVEKLITWVEYREQFLYFPTKQQIEDMCENDEVKSAVSNALFMEKWPTKKNIIHLESKHIGYISIIRK